MRRKTAYYRTSRPLAIRSFRLMLRRLERAKKTRTFRLVRQARPLMVLSPLHFRRRAVVVSVSEEEQRVRYLHVRSVRQRGYRRLTESSEALTSLFPQLISKIIGNRAADSVMSYADAAALVQSTY